MGVSLKQGVVEEINTGLMIVNSLGECRRFETLNDIEMGRRLVWKFFFFLFFFSAPPPPIEFKIYICTKEREILFSMIY